MLGARHTNGTQCPFVEGLVSLYIPVNLPAFPTSTAPSQLCQSLSM